MDEEIKNKVFNWILNKIEKGETSFDVQECTEDVGLNPEKKDDIEKVDKIFRWNEQKTNEFTLNIFEGNN